MARLSSLASSIVVVLFCVGLAYAQTLTIAGEQTRGIGRNGELRSNPVRITGFGHITGVRFSGSNSFWMECRSACQGANRFTTTGNGDYRTWRIPPGNWGVFPDLLPGQNKAAVTVTIQYGK